MITERPDSLFLGYNGTAVIWRVAVDAQDAVPVSERLMGGC